MESTGTQDFRKIKIITVIQGASLSGRIPPSWEKDVTAPSGQLLLSPSGQWECHRAVQNRTQWSKHRDGRMAAANPEQGPSLSLRHPQLFQDL